MLAPHQLYDYNIHIDGPESPESLEYSLLWYQSMLKLQETKRFLEENLQWGFIELSQSLFTSLILFVKKSNDALRFCIDYWKLNNLIWKDRYLLSLINEMLARLSKAKVYTKLDI
jgi:hypothetical protein